MKFVIEMHSQIVWPSKLREGEGEGIQWIVDGDFWLRMLDVCFVCLLPFENKEVVVGTATNLRSRAASELNP